jgi:hypothetical protein
MYLAQSFDEAQLAANIRLTTESTNASARTDER